MNDRSSGTIEPVRLSRRGFLAVPLAAALPGLLRQEVRGEAPSWGVLTREKRDRLTPAEVLALLQQGNERFRTGRMIRRDYRAQQKATAHGQYPAAVILSCVDSRVPVEIIMDLGLGEAFNSRIAANVVDEDVLGGLEFACKVSGAKLILVMGHTSCGAIKGAIDHVELGNLTGLLAKIRPAVPVTPYDGQRSSKNPAFVDAVARRNVELAREQIRQRSGVLREMEAQGAIKVAGAMYHLETGAVEFFD